MKSVPRATRGGGLAVIFRTSLESSDTVTNFFAFDHSSFELLELTLSLQHIQLHIFFFIYIQAPSQQEKPTLGLAGL